MMDDDGTARVARKIAGYQWWAGRWHARTYPLKNELLLLFAMYILLCYTVKRALLRLRWSSSL
jgi:hypothetical protein